MAKKYSLESYNEKQIEEMQKSLVKRRYWHFKVISTISIPLCVVFLILAYYSEGEARISLLTSALLLLLLLGVLGVFTHLLAKSYEKHLAKTKYPGGVTAIVAKRDNQ